MKRQGAALKTSIQLGGTFKFPGTDLVVNRMGYGAMQLTGPMIWGPPKDVNLAKSVLREAIESGINHIDTSDYYGPHVVNQIIKDALYPYPQDLVIVTKVGGKRGDDKSWLRAIKPDDIVAAIHDNLRNLKLEAIDIVNLRLGDMFGPSDELVEEPLAALIDLKKQGLIKHIGLSTVSLKQFEEASRMTDIVCVQNLYNVARRGDDELLDKLAAKGVAYVPYFPLGGIEPLQMEVLNQAAKKLNATPMQVALAWLLQRSPNVLLIPGTGSLEHLRENTQAASITLPDEVITELNQVESINEPPTFGRH
jgi:aryl-alcohol dehydrogenase-like predicted oxidoreductase